MEEAAEEEQEVVEEEEQEQEHEHEQEWWWRRGGGGATATTLFIKTNRQRDTHDTCKLACFQPVAPSFAATPARSQLPLLQASKPKP